MAVDRSHLVTAIHRTGEAAPDFSGDPAVG
jgi:hypothetical protein